MSEFTWWWCCELQSETSLDTNLVDDDKSSKTNLLFITIIIHIIVIMQHGSDYDGHHNVGSNQGQLHSSFCGIFVCAQMI